MKRYHSAGFGATLKTLMQQHRLTAGTLGATLGETAALRRALNENLSPAKRREVYLAICRAAVFTPEEEALLAEAMSVSELGLERHLCRKALGQLLRTDSARPESCRAECAADALDAFLNELDSDSSLFILCVNSLFSSICSTFRSLLQNPARDVNIRHYLSPGAPGRSISEYLQHLHHLIFDARYSVFTPGEPYTGTAHLPVDGNLLIIRGQRNGRSREALFVALDEQDIRRFPVEEIGGCYGYFRDLLELPLAARHMNVQPADPLDYGDTCLEVLSYELNRKTHIITPDLSMALLPPDVLKKAVRPQMPLRFTEPAAMTGLYSLQTKRYQYSNDTRKERCLITSGDGVRSFLESGRLADHPQMLRTLLPKERLMLLDTVLHHVANNRKLSFRLTLNEHYQCPYQLRCHDHLSVTLHKPVPAHSQEKPYVTLQSADFADQLQDYLDEVMLKKKCMSDEESIAALKQLRDVYARDAND